MTHHNSDPACPACNEKLSQAHIYLVGWFTWIKGNHPDTHVCWAFRGEEDQHQAYINGKSKLDWPMSRHNCMENGMPCSRALDVFQIIDHQAIFDPDFYKQIRDETLAAGYALRFGMDFQHFPDLDHVEMEVS